jgi:hypothetical protein
LKQKHKKKRKVEKEEEEEEWSQGVASPSNPCNGGRQPLLSTLA